jgi:hypothetical protein
MCSVSEFLEFDTFRLGTGVLSAHMRSRKRGGWCGHNNTPNRLAQDTACLICISESSVSNLGWDVR